MAHARRPGEDRAVSGKNRQGEPLRVALVAGGLGKGGAEKQLVYMARALKGAGVDVRVYCLSRGEFYERALSEMGLAPRWIGQHASPPLRVLKLTAELITYRPHIVQSAHFYTNLYAAAASRACGAVSIGSIRSDALYEMKMNRFYGPLLLRAPGGLIANSNAARLNAPAIGARAGEITVVSNVIDIEAFDREAGPRRPPVEGDGATCMVVCNLRAKKRVDVFLRALAIARRDAPTLRGVVVGDGEKRNPLEAEARELGLLPAGVEFLGRRDDVPALMRRGDIFVMPSEHEGFPNVILEAMAASLPVVTTPAGDAATVVVNGVTGYVVDFDDVEGMAGHLAALWKSREMRERAGNAGRRRVEQDYSFGSLGARLLAVYAELAARHGNSRLRMALQTTSISGSHLNA